MPRKTNGGAYADKGRFAAGARGRIAPASTGDVVEALRDFGAALAQDGAVALASLLTRNDGWLRCVPHDDGAVVFFKWKFSKGPWRGHYVMFRCDDMNYNAAWCGLAQKLLHVDAGLKRPTLDSAYDQE